MRRVTASDDIFQCDTIYLESRFSVYSEMDGDPAQPGRAHGTASTSENLSRLTCKP